MFSRFEVISPLSRDKNTLEGLKAFQHTPFICLKDRGLCWYDKQGAVSDPVVRSPAVSFSCSPENPLCKDRFQKECATFKQKSHKCEKVRHRVYNSTKRNKTKGKKRRSVDAGVIGKKCSRNSQGFEQSFRTEPARAEQEDNSRRKKQRNT